MKKLLLVLMMASFTSLAICFSQNPAPYEELFIQIQVEQALGGYIDDSIKDEPIDIQALLLDYAENKELALKAWIALTKYPDKARKILSDYGLEPEFKDILLNYGESIIPPIHYFVENEIWTLELKNAIAKRAQSMKAAAGSVWNWMTGKEEINAAEQTQPTPFEPVQRGWYAVNYIKQEGHDFLGQFVVGDNKEVKWNQTERFVEGFSAFFTSGVRSLETNYKLGNEITGNDVFWAGVDVVAVGGALKLLRIGKTAAASGKQWGLATRTRLFASKLFLNGKVVQKLAKWSFGAVTAYIVLTHPSLLNSLFVEVASWLGLPSWLIQFIGWFIIAFVILYPFFWLLKLLIGFIVWGLNLLILGLSLIEKSTKKSSFKINNAASDLMLPN